VPINAIKGPEIRYLIYTFQSIYLYSCRCQWGYVKASMFENLIKMFLLFFQIGFSSLQILIKKIKIMQKS